ncbi:MAG: ArsR/SmtB family transcription factor [Candidatus Zipacnadales bacterium]
MEHRQLVRVFGALNSEIRLRILKLVAAHNEMCVCELVEQLRLSQANISRHVSILRDAGLLRERKVGTWVLLHVDESVLEEAATEVVRSLRQRHQASQNESAERRLKARCKAISS